jgi:large conductance mechanosensitive channel
MQECARTNYWFDLSEAHMSVIQEFKTFALRGNVVDLAVGVIIGAAFGKVVSSLVEAVIMPLLGLMIGKVDFSTLSLSVGKANIRYGLFVQAAFDFILVAFAIFMVVKAMNRMKRKEEAAPAPTEPPADVKLLGEIRDLLRARG